MNSPTLLVLFSLLWLSSTHFLAPVSGQIELDLTKKVLHASVTDQSVQVDGRLDETAWQVADVATDLVQEQPFPGGIPSQQTEVRVLYDNIGMYIGARLYDTAPDSILQELAERDGIGNSDWFGVFVGPYRDGLNGLSFIVTPSNGQLDAKYSPNSGEDDSWDAVWKSSTRIDEQGWVAELFIPWSALRFPEAPEQVWQLNFCRLLRRINEKSWWSELDPEVNGFINQWGYLRGIKGIDPPVRLQATPFIASYLNSFYDKNTNPRTISSTTFTGGMDMKYGISDAFTLDMTLIPDFGEARSDNQVLNLSPFEVRFDENRPFFNEGTELFNKGGFFYSRRVGGQPFDRGAAFRSLEEGEEVVSNPGVTGLLNATKVSGRNRKGLGIGFFNAIAGREFATLRHTITGREREVQTNPLTNYSVAVLDQNLPNNSYFSLLNTNVLREGTAYDANVTAGLVELNNASNSYRLRIRGALSQKYFPGETELGTTYNLSLSKTSGQLRLWANYNVEDERYDPNDLGFLFNNNERSAEIGGRYMIFEPFGPLNEGGLGVELDYQRLYRPDVYTNASISWFTFGQTKGFWNYDIWGNYEPWGSVDYFEPRIWGQKLNFPSFSNHGFWIGSDDRKRIRITLNYNYNNWSEKRMHRHRTNSSIRYRASDRLSLQISHSETIGRNIIGFATLHQSIDPQSGLPGPRQSIIGKRHQHTIENNLSTSYKFSANMILSLRGRHYWSQVDYQELFALEDDGNLTHTDYDGNHNTTFNSFNIDLIYRWRFAPGSDIFFVWKNSIIAADEDAAYGYFRHVSNLGDLPQRNNLSLKVVYFLDYVELTRKR